MSETDPTAYIYEQRIVPNEDEWKETTSIHHPRELEKNDLQTADYRNVRPLYEKASKKEQQEMSSES